uniref:Uncharacterized protein n=1 Tax=Rhizophora mucronata TaxID=61149 RepID=A0A2P2IPB9_RHIMU
MRMMEDSLEGSKTPGSVHTENSLLDAYEIESISRQLDYFMRSSRNMFDSKLLDRNLRRQRTVYPESDARAVKKKKKKSFLSRFRLRHGVLCGTRHDEDTRALGE